MILRRKGTVVAFDSTEVLTLEEAPGQESDILAQASALTGVAGLAVF